MTRLVILLLLGLISLLSSAKDGSTIHVEDGISSILRSDRAGRRETRALTFAETSRHAYVTILHGIDESNAYRGFLFNVLLMKHVLSRAGSSADFIAMVGFTQHYDTHTLPESIAEDLSLLESHGVRLLRLPRLRDSSLSPRVNFMEMALQKLTTFNLTDYERVQFMDADVLPRRSLDCLFSLDRNTFNTGSASPLNSGWFLALPNRDDYETMRALALQRMHSKWDEERGWGTSIAPAKLHFRQSPRRVERWSFNGASLDQGLLTHHFVLHEGRAQLLDGDRVLRFYGDLQRRECAAAEVLDVCNGSAPMDMFYHYTGRSKPWLRVSQDKKDRALKYWLEAFDELGFNRSVLMSNLRSPLGYFHPNK